MTKKRLIISLIFTASFGLSNVCFAYVTPDWDAIARANAKQNPTVKSSNVDYKQEKKNNKRQEVKKIKKSKKHKTKIVYKYDRKAEKRRNERQEVK